MTMIPRLTITRCEVVNDKIELVKNPADGVDIFELTINPESYNRKYSVNFSGTGKGQGGVIGMPAPAPEFAGTEAEELSFDITLDGTGVVEASQGMTVSQQIASLRDIAYTFQGSDHQPSPVEINWGDELKAFRARLSSMSVDYTLFRSDGTPLRAKLSLNFIEALTPKEVATEADLQSPDLTHIVQVLAGDTLPLLCQRIYKDPTKYLAVAAFNRLDGFRALPPGTLLQFPPMR